MTELIVPVSSSSIIFHSAKEVSLKLFGTSSASALKPHPLAAQTLAAWAWLDSAGTETDSAVVWWQRSTDGQQALETETGDHGWSDHYLTVAHPLEP